MKKEYGWQTLLNAVIIILLSLALAGLHYSLRPIPLERPLPEGLEQLTLEQAKSLEPLWVDARLQKFYEISHIPDAVNLNPDNWGVAFAAFAAVWRPERVVVVYCDGGACTDSATVALKLKEAIPSVKVYILKGGYPAWR